jgi:hypothetical protein|tara:strand:+ start:871 stop:1161 length:291 start_codon:yes stop_codon:yes gene_type:complete
MAFKGYKLSSKFVYCYFDDNHSSIVRMWFIHGMPFTFDSLEKEELEDVWVKSEAAINPEFTLEQIEKVSSYLMEEEMHPLLFEVPLVGKLPDDTFS